MSNSYLQFDYRLRLCKCIERKLFCVFLNEYNRLYSLKDFDYIGFGSLYFSDFIMFHNQYSFKKFFSIEDMNDDEGELDTEKSARFDFNKPYDFIEIKGVKSTKALVEMKISKAMVWLDYDERLDNYMFEDIEILAERLTSGSLIIITLSDQMKSGFISKSEDKIEYRDEKKFSDYYENHIYRGITRTDISKGQYSKTVKELFEYKIKKTLKNRIKIEKIEYVHYQLSYIKYADGSPMVTYIFGIYKKEELEKLLKSDIIEKEIFKDADKPYTINVPLLTELERNYINRNLYKDTDKIKEKIGLSIDEIDEYKKNYRYYPNFKEVIQ